MKKIFFTILISICLSSYINFSYGQSPKLIFGSENELLSNKDNNFNPISQVNNNYIATYLKGGKIPTLLEIDGNCNRIKEKEFIEFEGYLVQLALINDQHIDILLKKTDPLLNNAKRNGVLIHCRFELSTFQLIQKDTIYDTFIDNWYGYDIKTHISSNNEYVAVISTLGTVGLKVNTTVALFNRKMEKLWEKEFDRNILFGNIDFEHLYIYNYHDYLVTDDGKVILARVTSYNASQLKFVSDAAPLNPIGPFFGIHVFSKENSKDYDFGRMWNDTKGASNLSLCETDDQRILITGTVAPDVKGMDSPMWSSGFFSTIFNPKTNKIENTDRYFSETLFKTGEIGSARCFNLNQEYFLSYSCILLKNNIINEGQYLFVLDKEGKITSNCEFYRYSIKSFLQEFKCNNKISFLITSNNKQLQLLSISPRNIKLGLSSLFDEITTLLDFSSKKNVNSISKFPDYLSSLEISDNKKALFFKTGKNYCIAILEL